MDQQIRTFKDFLQLYNKITELCFKNCVDNFLSRKVANEEEDCVNKCVMKFANVNQRIMSVYVEVQTAINARRLAEIESQVQQQQAKAQQEVAENKTTVRTGTPTTTVVSPQLDTVTTVNQLETPELLTNNR